MVLKVRPVISAEAKPHKLFQADSGAISSSFSEQSRVLMDDLNIQSNDVRIHIGFIVII